MKILIAYDGSTCANEALNDLPRAGLPRQAEALIVNVKELSLPFWSGEDVAEEVSVLTNSVGAQQKKTQPQYELTFEMLNSAAERINAHFPEWKTEFFQTKGSPAREILNQAKTWGANLIVVGSHSKTETRRFSLGSVSQKIANEAECSVRIVRGETWKNGSPSRLLIGLDGTTSAMLAVEEVAGRMWSMGSEVRLVLVQDKAGKNSTNLCEYVENAAKLLQRAELSVTELIEEGNPKQLLVSAAEEWGADCIFLGANDSDNFFENQLLGSVSTAIVGRSHCTVEIVRKK
jgi:nucleotide-binding universal stress UspA family protein